MLWEGSLGDSKGEYLYKIFSGSEETFKNIFPKFGIKVSEVPLDSKARFFNFRQDSDLVKFFQTCHLQRQHADAGYYLD